MPNGTLFVAFAKAGAKVLHFFELCKYFMKKVSLILIFVSLTSLLCAQVQVRTFNEQIRTLRVPRTVLVLQDGFIDGSEPDNTLHISFDEMSHDVHMYTYTVRHMNAESTQESGLTSNEYIS